MEAVLDPLVQSFIAVLVPVALFTADQIDDGLKLTIDGLQISDQGIGGVAEQLIQGVSAVQQGVHGVLQLISFFRNVVANGVNGDVRLFRQLFHHVP